MKKMTNRKFALPVGLTALAMLGSAQAATVTHLGFEVRDGVGEIKITTDSPVVFEKAENELDRQLVIDIPDATVAQSINRKLDTSSFDSKVSLISPYQVNMTEDGAQAARIVVQLRDMVRPEVTQDGNTILIRVPNQSDPLMAGADTAAEPGLEMPPGPDAASDAQSMGSDGAIAAVNLGGAGNVATPAAAQVLSPAEKTLVAFEEAQRTRRFVGKPITIQVKDADLVDVFRLIGDASGFNVVVGEDVRGKVTLSLVDVPWDQVLDLVLRSQQLGAERSNNILRVMTLGALTKEKEEELRAKQAVQASAPRVTRVFPISYANLGDITGILRGFNSAAGSAGSSVAGAQNVIQEDQRTNSIIVRDVPEAIERFRKLIEVLDTQTPQIMIEAKIVEASEEFARSLGGNLGVSRPSGTVRVAASGNGAEAISSLISSGGNFGESTTGGAGIGLSFLPGFLRLNSVLSFAEQENKLRVIASPKTVVLNKESATIVQSEPVAIPVTNVSAGVVTNAFEIQNAQLSLNVSPTVTNDGSVLMQLSIQRDVPQSAGQTTAVSNRNLTTKVLVQSGTTLVIGGIYTMTTEEQSSGVPWLRKIPIIGALFGSESAKTKRSELFIFITPRILNEKEAGLVS